MPAYNGGDFIDEQQLSPDTARQGNGAAGQTGPGPMSSSPISSGQVGAGQVGPSQVGQGDVVIRISGDTAAQMLFRSNEEVRRLTQAVGDLAQKLESLETSLHRREEAHEGLAHTVQVLGAQLGSINGQIAGLAAQSGQAAQMQGDIDRLRNNAVDQGYQFRHLQERLEQAQGEISRMQSDGQSLQEKASSAEVAAEQMKGRLDRLETASWWSGLGADRLKSTAERIKRLHLGLGLWVAGIAVTLAVAAASAAVLIYT